MHRTRHFLKLGAWGLLTAGLAAGPSAAQPPAPPPPEVAPPAAGTLAPRRGAAVVVAINGTQKLSMSSKKVIRSVINEKESVARIQPIKDDPNAVLVVGLTAGSTKVTLTDIDGMTESYDVLVQLDIDAVKSVIRLTFPTANVIPIAAGTNTMVLTGNVAHAEDIEPILRVARGVITNAGTGVVEVYNAMTVGGVRQVQLDVTIAQVNRTEARRRNANWIIDGNTVSFGSLLPGLIHPTPPPQGTGGAGVGVLPFSALAAPNSVPNVVFGVVPANFNALIQALREERLAKLLAEPKLVTMSGHPAEFLSGGQQAVISASSGVSGAGVEYKPVGTRLQFLPIVLNNGKIFLEVSPSVIAVDNALGANTTFGFSPGFNMQTITTHVTMEAGQTFAIGGLIQSTTQASSQKVPFLGDLPFVGTIFSSVENTEQEQELVVLVTPYLVDPMDCKQAPCKLPGNETRKPDDFELFLESILEAPRGQRDVFPGRKYMPAWKNDPTADKYPCGGDRGGCTNGCSNGTCGSGVVATSGMKPIPVSAIPVPVTAGDPMPK